MYKIKLSPYSKMFYTEWILDPTSSRYNLSIDQLLYGHVEVDRMTDALRRYVSDHVILNSHIESIDDEPYWVPNSFIKELEYLDLPPADTELRSYANGCFNLYNDTLYRFRLIRVNDNMFRIILIFHHLVLDGSCVDKGLFEELPNYYHNKNYNLKYSTIEQINLITNLSNDLFAKIDKNKDLYQNFWHNQLLGVEAIDLRFLKILSNSEKTFTTKIDNLVKEIRFNFDEKVILNLNIIKRSYLVTPYIFGQVIFAILLYKYTGQDNFAISYPITVNEGRDLIYGAQVNTNLIPYKFSSSTSIHDILAQARNFFKKLKEDNLNYGYYPIAEIIQEGNKRLLDVAFVQTNLKDKKFQFQGIEQVEILKEFNIDSVAPASFIDSASPLFFEQEIRSHQLNYRIRFDKSIIDESLLVTFINNYKSLFITVLEDLINSKDKKLIHSYSIVDEFTYKKLVYEYNRTQIIYPENKTIHQLFEEQVLRTPNNPAVIYEDIELTYEQLNNNANQLAHYIKSRYKITKDSLVTIFLHRNEYMLISILGILKAGAAYVPIDINYPNERINYILKDTKASLLLTNESYKVKLLNIIDKNINKNLMILEVNNPEIVHQPITNPEVKMNSKDLAYVIYTSGTTGQPKGVMLEHKSIVNRITWMNNAFPLTMNDRILQKTPYVFDVSVWELFWANWYGATVVFAKPDGHKNPNYLIEIINKYKISIIHFIPSMLNIFEETLVKFKNKDLLPSLRYVFCSGEVLNLSMVQQLKDLLPNIGIHNLYGPTEAAIDVLHYNCSNSDINAIYVGKPIQNIHAYVLDNNLAVLPVGAIGELYIGGVCLARGYLNLPEITKEKFIINPLQNHQGLILNDSRLYKTGDRARWLPNGNLDFIDRNDYQVKLRGYRIELGEIEHVLNKYPGIKQSVAMVKEYVDIDNNVTGNKYLIVYYVLEKSDNKENLIEYIGNWQQTYEEIYTKLCSSTYKNDFTGWNSSYTGLPLEKEHMQEWLDNTIIKIKNLNPDNILEIGSGSGLMLFNLSGLFNYYYATDFSENALGYLRKGINKYNLDDKVSLINCRADEVLYSKFEHSIDTVIMNSVIQYFPNVDYLGNIIEGMITKLNHVSQIFIGDIRNYNLLDMFYYSILSYQRKKVTSKLIEFYKFKENELLVSPEYFLGLTESIPQIDYVEILAKEGYLENEMNKFRYDIIIHLNHGTNENQSIDTINYEQFQIVNDISHYIKENINSRYICIKYPNKNLFQENEQYQNNILNKVCQAECDILDIRSIKKLASDNELKVLFYLDPYDCEYLNLFFSKNTTLKKFKINYLIENKKTYANDPNQIPTVLNSSFTNDIRLYLSQRLPSYMIPDILINLAEFPLNINGKLEKDALPEPELVAIENYLAPQTETEKKICTIYAEVLALTKEQVGINHDFFKLGGNSILAIRLARILQHDFKISVTDIFRLKTPAMLAKFAVFSQSNLHNKLEQIKFKYIYGANVSPKDQIAMDIKYKKYLDKVANLKFKSFSKNINCVLLTGATGYLGCNILYQLLKANIYKTIYLLVRGESDYVAYNRLDKKVKYYFDINLKDYSDKVIVIASDLEQPHLSLNEVRYNELVGNVDSIIHSAALVKHYGDYDNFYKANVQATLNLLELAKLTKLKDFHYISTIGVLHDGYIQGQSKYVFDENDDPGILERYNNVYVNTKYEGELAVNAYRKYGVNSNIYRLGNLFMDSTTYINQDNLEDNALYIRIKTLLNLGIIAKEIAQLEISPIDNIASAIVKLFNQGGLNNQTFHLFNPKICDLSELFKDRLKTIPIGEFIDKISAISDLNNDIELFMLHQLWLQETDYSNLTDIKVVSDKTNLILSQLGFCWSSITAKMISSAIL